MSALAKAAVCGLFVGAAQAQVTPPPSATGTTAGTDAQSAKAEAADWLALDRVQVAARVLNYSGTYVYQRGPQVSATRITHFFDGKDEHEKLEMLDGVQQEFVRMNDQVQCFTPGSKTVSIERRPPEGMFPQLLSGASERVRQVYKIKRGGTDRVAQVECDVYNLTPKDNLRYGYRLCIERAGGLLVKAQTLDEKQQLVEHIAFTDLKIGVPIDRKKLKPSYRADKSAGWRVDEPVQERIDLANSGLALSNLPAGFQKIFGMRRTLGQQTNVRQIVLSDGLASVSVFVEPAEATTMSEGAWSQGASNMVSRTRGPWRVTTVGETPTSTLLKITNSLEIRQP